MTRHPADGLDDDPEVRAVLDEDYPLLDPMAFNFNPGAAAARLSDWEVGHARRLRAARERAHARRTAANRAPYRWGGWTVLIVLALSCWLCGFACALFV